MHQMRQLFFSVEPDYLPPIPEPDCIMRLYHHERQEVLRYYLQNFKSDFINVWYKIPLPLAGAAAFSTCVKQHTYNFPQRA